MQVIFCLNLPTTQLQGSTEVRRTIHFKYYILGPGYWFSRRSRVTLYGRRGETRESLSATHWVGSWAILLPSWLHHLILIHHEEYSPDESHLFRPATIPIAGFLKWFRLGVHLDDEGILAWPWWPLGTMIGFYFSADIFFPIMTNQFE